MTKIFERFALWIPASLAVVNLAAVAHSLWKGESLLLSTLATCVSVASTWFVYLTRNYYGALTRRMESERAVFAKMAQILPAMAELEASDEDLGGVKH